MIEIKSKRGLVLKIINSNTLTNANLTDANLTDAYLRNADLRNADLRNADLTNADLTNADLTNANLRYANLTDAYLTNADLTNANIPIYSKRQISIIGDYIQVGCKRKTIDEWIDWLNSDEEYETKRNTEEFKRIEAHISAYITYINVLKS